MAQPTGRFDIGYTDFEYHHSDDWQPGGEHLVGALFYPVDRSKDNKRLPRATWVPEYGHAQGFADFIRKLGRLTGGGSWVPWPIVQPPLAWFTYLLGGSQKLPAYKGAQLTQAEGPLPALVLSHGAGGNRMVQSCLCLELASQGFLVLSLEHADGSSSATRMAAGVQPRWRFFEGLPPDRREAQIRFRMEEGRTAARLLQALAAGDSATTAHLRLCQAPPGLLAGLAGRVDTGCLCCMGHSFGAGPSCALPAEAGSPYRCGIGMDPSWPPLPADHPVFTGFQSQGPILAIGCETWNNEDEKSFIRTDKEKQAAVIAAASRERGGGGSIFLVMRGVGHASFTDADVLYGGMTPNAFRAVPKKALGAKLIMRLLKEVVLTFLLAHLPLSEAQRARVAIPSATGWQALASPEAEGVAAVAAAEAAVYERILGKENVYALTVTP